MEQIKQEFKNYWSGRAESYSDYNRQEMKDERRENWKTVLLDRIFRYKQNADPSAIKILDIGTGPGFFARLLSEEGFSVTAIDCTEEMLREAKENAGSFSSSIRFVLGDVETLPFSDETFDVCISRNVTWNLPHPDKAYREWHRVLKKKGILLNFDADWYGYLYDEEKKEAYNTDRVNTAKEQLEDCNVGENFDQCEELAKKVPLSKAKRPDWDIAALNDCGFSSVECDPKIWESVWSEAEKVSCASTPMFLLHAIR